MLKPLKNKVILSEEKNEKTKSGIVLTNELEKSSSIARIVAIPQKITDEENSNVLKVGNLVIINKFSGSKIEYDDKEYIVIDINNILAIVEED